MICVGAMIDRWHGLLCGLFVLHCDDGGGKGAAAAAGVCVLIIELTAD